MKFRSWIEAVEKIDVPYSMGAQYVYALKNPTAQETKEWLTKFNELRALSDGKNIWVWKALLADHKTISDALGLDYYNTVINDNRWTIKNPGQIDLIWDRRLSRV